MFSTCDQGNPKVNTLDRLTQLPCFFLEKNKSLILTFTVDSSRSLSGFSAVEMEILPWAIAHPSGQNGLKEHITQK